MVTFNKSLINYIEYIYGQIDEDQQYSLFGMGNTRRQVEIINIDKLLFHYFLTYCKESGKKISFAKQEQEMQVWQRCIHELKKRFDDIKLLDMRYLGFLKKEVLWIKACNFMDLEVYQTADRLGRTGSKNAEGPGYAIFRILLWLHWSI